VSIPVPTNGNALVAVISTRGTSGNRVSSITQSGATWTRAGQGTNTASSGSTVEIWCAPNVTNAGTTVTVNLGASLFASAAIIEYSGLAVTNPADVSAGASGNSISASTGSTPTTTQTNEVWVGGIGLANSTYTLSALLNSFASVSNVVSTSGTAGNNANLYVIERIVAAKVSALSGGTVSSSSQWSGTIATFKAVVIPGSSLVLGGSAASNYTLTGLSGSVAVTPATVTVASGLSANNKAYDGTTAGTISSNNVVLGGVVAGDANSVVLSTNGYVAAFDGAGIGAGRTVTVANLTLAGSAAADYTLAQPVQLSADITAAAVTIASGLSANNKIYDGTTGATISSNNLVLSGVVAGDMGNVGVATVGYIASFNTPFAGTGKAVNVLGLTLTGSAATNYSLAQPTLSADITAAALSITAGNQGKTYGAALVLGTTNFTASGLLGGDTVSGVTLTSSGSSATASVGTYNIVPSAATGSGLTNYSITYNNGTLTVGQASLSITAGNQSKVYGATLVLGTTNFTASGLLNGDTVSGVTLSSSGSGPSANVGSYGIVPSAATGSGLANYSIAYNNGTLTVGKATPIVATAPTPSGITYGQTLASSTLSGGTVTNASGGTVSGSFAYTTPAIAPNAGSTNVSVTFTPTDTANYNNTTTTVSVSVSKQTPVVASAPTPSIITYGQTLANSTLTGGTATNAAGATVVGSFAFTTPSIAPNAGTTNVSVTFTPTDLTNYNTTTTTVTVTVNKQTPIVFTAPTPSAIAYGQTLASSTLSGGTVTNAAGATVVGSFAFTSPTIAPNAGTTNASVTFTPTDTANYNTATKTVTVTVNKAVPVVTAPVASAITYGQTLAASTLSGGAATNANNSATVAGSFAFATPTIAPNAGTTNVSVIFTPTDTANNNTVTTTVAVTVNKQTPTLTAPVASAITYGQTLASSTLSGGTATNANNNVSVSGSFAYTTPNIAPNAGTTNVSVTFTPTDTANYNTATTTVNVSVNKGTPLVATAPTTSAITYGQTLASSTLIGGTVTNSAGATVTGNFTYTTPSIAPNAGTTNVSVTFTPDDPANYNTTTKTVAVSVIKATPALATPLATTITYGQTLASSSLSGGAATNVNNNVSVAGSFAFTTPSIMPNAGTTNVSVTFTPTDLANYNTATTTVTVTVNKQTPIVSTAPTPSAISYGQALASSTFTGGTVTNAAGATVVGSFAFTTPAIAPNAGTTNVSVTFTPVDTANYNTATKTVTVTVNKAVPVLTAPVATAITYGQTLAASTLSGGMATNANNNAAVTGSFAFTTPSLAPNAGSTNVSVTFTPTDTANYNNATATVTVTVGKQTPVVATAPTPSAIAYGQTLASSTLSGGTVTNAAGGTVTGSFAYTTPTIAPNAGSTNVSVTFTPTDTANYNTATKTITVTVNKGTPIIASVPSPSAITYGQTLASSTLSGGSATNASGATVSGSFAFTTPTIAPNAGTTNVSVMFTPTDTTDYNTATMTVAVTVNAASLTITANNDSKTYGQSKSYGAGQTTYGSSGLQNGDTIGSVTITASGGTATNSPVGTYSLTPSAATGGSINTNNYAITYGAGTLTVNPLAVNLTGSRSYDGTTNAVYSMLSVANALGGDVVTVASGTAGLSSAAVGNRAIASLGTLTLGGARSTNYTLAGAGGSVSIGALPVALSGSRNYDGTASAAASVLTITNILAGDTVSLSGGSATLTSRNQGQQSFTGNTLTLTGASAANYTAAGASGAVLINKTNLTVSAVANTKAYDGTTNAAAVPTITSGGVQAGDTATAWVEYYDNPNMGTGKTLTPAGVVNDGNGGNNYNYTYVAVNTGAINQGTVTISSGLTVNDKVYDGTTAATLSSNNVVLSGVWPADVNNVALSTNGYTATFDTASVGTGKTVTVSGLSLTGSAAANYTFVQPAGMTASLTARPVVLTGTRVYDGTTLVTATNLVISNNIDGGNLSLSGTAVIAVKDVGSQSVSASATIANITRVKTSVGSVGSSAATSFNVAIPVPTNGNALVAVISTRGNAGNRVSSVTQSGAVWTRASQGTNTVNGGSTVEIWCAPNVTNAGTTVTVNLGSSVFAAAAVMEYSGLAATNPADVFAGASGNSISASTGSTPTTTQTNEVWVGGFSLANSTYTLSGILNSFASVANVASTSGTAGNNANLYAIERIAAAIAPALSGGTVSSSSQWSGTIATFKAAVIPGSSLVLGGSAAGNYTLTGLSGSVVVTPATVTVVSGLSANSKAYDGTTAGTINSNNVALGGVFAVDASSVTVVTNGYTAVFDGAGIGAGRSVTVANLTLAGSAAADYTLTQPVLLSADITATVVTIASGLSGNNKVYDGTTGATISSNNVVLSGVLAGDMGNVGVATAGYTASFNTAFVGTGKAVNVLGLTLTGSAATNYSLAQPTLSANITPAALGITAGNQGKTYGAALVLGTTNFTASGLLGGDTVSGVTLTSSGSSATALVGTYSIVPSAAAGSGLTNYSITYNNGVLTVGQASLSITAGNQSKVYGATLVLGTTNFTASGLLNGDTVSGVTLSSSGSDASATVGSYSIVPSAATGSGLANYSIVYNNGTLTVGKATPIIAGAPTPSGISYGQTLASSTLSGGTVTNASGATVSGSFAYTTPAIAPNAGTTNVSVTFTPTDTANYNNATATVTVTVGKQTPVLASAPTASTITYGQTLANSTLTGGTATNAAGATVTGGFAYTTPAIAPNAGTTNVSVTFTPTDTANYNTTTTSVTLTVNKQTPVVATAPTATSIAYGQTLASSSLSGGTATNAVGAAVSGSFAYTTPAIAPNAGSTNVSVTFTPTDTANYNTATKTVTVTVNKAVPVLTAPVATAITYGQTLASSTLSGGAATNANNNAAVAGSFAFTTPTIAPNAGSTNVSVTFTPTDLANYNTATTTVTVTVNKQTPVVATSPTPSAIAYGQTLASSTLSGGTVTNAAGATVVGSFAFTTPTIAPNAGSTNVSVTFTPTDTANYNTATKAVTVTVNKGTPIIASAPSTSAITYGQTLASSSLTGGSATNASGATVSGNFAFTTPAIAPNAGTTNVSVTFTPTDVVNYNTATTTVTVTVNAASLTIAANNDSKIYGQSKTYGAGQTTFSSSGLQNGDSIGTVTITASGGTATNSPVGTYNLTPSSATGGSINTNNYVITYSAGTLTVNPLAVNLAGSRSYDATTNAVFNILTVANALGGDVVTVASGNAGLSSASVGTRAITSLGMLTLGGARATNYTLSGASGSVTIGALPVALSGSRNYNGTASAAASILTITNILAGDTVTLNSGSATLSSRNQGQQNITSNTLTLSGTSAANYTTTGASGLVMVGKTNLTVTAVANTKPYDGTTNAAAVPTVTSGSVQTGDTAPTWVEYYDDPNMGTGKTLTPAGVVNDGNGGNNYNYTYVSVTTGVIGGVAVTISSGLTANDKVYDGTTVATISSNNVVLSGVAPADVNNVFLSTNGYSASFDAASAGTGKSVTVTGLSLTGSAAANYTFVQPAGMTASIMARPVVLTGTRVYDGTTLVTATNLVISNNIDGGNLSLSGTAVIAARDVGTELISTAASTANVARVKTSVGSVGSSAATSFNVTVPVPTNGNALVAVISTRGNAGNQVSSITQSGAVWTRASQGTNTASGGSTVEIWCAPNVSNAGTAVTVNLASSLFASAVVMEYSGLTTNSPADVFAGASGNSISASTGSTPTTTQTNEVWVGGIGLDTSADTLSAILNSFISVTNVASGNGTAGKNALVYAIERIAAAKAPALSGGTVSSSAQWSGTMATFKAALSSGTPLVLSGPAAGNYTLTGLSGTVAVTPAPVTVASGLTANAKAYDGTAVGTISSNNVVLGGVVAGDAGSVTVITNGYAAAFDSAGIGTAKNVTVSNLSLAGSGAGNYSLTQPVMLSADITAAAVTIASGLSANNKIYDGTTGATISSNNVVLSGVLAGDMGNVGVATVGYTASFNTPFVGTGKAVNVLGLTLTGSAATNYSLAQPTLSANITAAALGITAGNQGKTYGAALVLGTSNFTASGLLGGDTVSGVTLTSSGSSATASVGTYNIVPSAAAGSGLTNYSITYNNGALTVGQANLSIMAGNQSKVYGATLALGTTNFTASGLLNGDMVSGVTLSSSGSDASASVGSYGIVPSAATGSGLANYSIVYNNGTLTVGKATPIIAGAPTPSTITYGQTLAASTLSGGTVTNASGATVSGSFAYTTPTMAPNSGTTNVNVTFTPTDTSNYNNTATTVSVSVGKQTPVVASAPTPSIITYGQTLAASTLSGGSATNAAGATVTGSFAYSTPGIAPNAGATNVSVTFTPTDTANYNTATTTVTVTVNKQTPIVSTAPTPSAIAYGQTLASSTLSGGTVTNAVGAAVSGNFAFTTPGLAPNAGTTNVSVTFTPVDLSNYNTATATVSVSVSKQTPVVATAPTPSTITYGQTVGASTLSGGTVTNSAGSTVSGSFAFTTPTIAPNAGSTNVSVTFTPTDTANYNNATATVSVTVGKQTPVVAAAPTPSAIVYGQTLANSSLSGGTVTNVAGGTVSGNFAFTTPSIAPNAGSTNVSVTFTPTDTANYNTATKTITVTVNKGTPIIASAPSPSAITYGQTLASSLLTGGSATNAAGATVSGSFAYTTPTIAPNAGTTNVSVTFTPVDMADYNTATVTVAVTVNKVALNITANNDSKTYGQSKTYGAGQTTFSSSGLQNGDTIGTVTIGASGGTATNSPVGTYNLTPSAATGGNINTNNYAITYGAGTLTVNPLAVNLTGSRSYDGTTNAIFNILTVANALGGDVVTVASGSAGLSSALVGTRAITSMGTLTLGGARATNYTLSGASGSVTIGALPVALSGSRIYDGTASAVASVLTITNILAGDTVTLSGGSATLSSRNQGQQSITGNTLTLSGASAANYTTAGAGGGVLINKTNLTVSAVANTKTYDGTTNAAAVPTITSGSVQAGDTATAWAEYYNDPNIGTGKTLTPAGVVNDGNGGNNYNYTYVAVASGVISGVAVTISSGLTVNDKVYDGTTAATLSSNNVVLSGVAPADANNVALSTNGYTANFDTASVGAGKSVTVTGLSLTGSAAANYTFVQPGGFTASITARPVVLTGTRMYDGTTVVGATNLVISNNIDDGNLTLSGTAAIGGKDVGTQSISAYASTANVARLKTSAGSSGSVAANSFNVTVPVPTNGNALVAVISTRGTAGNQVTGLTQSGAIWTRASQGTNTANGGSTVEIWCAPNVTNAGTTVTVNLASSLHAAAVVMEYSGLVTTNPTDVSAGASGNNINANTGSTPTTTQPNEVWVGGIGLDTSADTLSAILNSFISVTNVASTDNPNKNALVYALERVAAANAPALSGGTVSSSAQWSGTMATFKAALSSGTPLVLSGPAAGNYTLTGLSGSVAITPAAVSITAGAQGKTYGAVLALGTTNFTASGLLGGDTISGVMLTSSGSDASALAGAYSIVPSAATGTGLSNYGIAYNNGTLTVSAAALSITAGDQSKTYGTTLALGTTNFTASGLLNGDTVSGVTLSSSGADASASVGSYAIVPSGATGSGLANYSIAYNNGTLTVNQQTPVVAVAPTASAITYGQTLASSTLSGGTVTNASGGTVAGSFAYTTPTTAPNAGSANVGVTFTPTDVANYNIATASVTVTVNKAALTITANNDNKTYGQTKNYGAGLTNFTSSGLKFGESIASVTISAGGGTGTNDPVGAYLLTPSSATGGTFNPANYTIGYNNGTLTINALPVNLAGSRTYDATTNVTAALLSVANGVGSDDVTVASGAGGLASKNAGSRALTSIGTLALGGARATNYTIIGATGSVTISQALLIVTATGVNKTYNGTTNATVTLSDNEISGDTVTDNYAAASFGDKNVGTNKPVTVTGISISGTDAGNYALSNTPARATENIPVAALAVVLPNA
jgi:prolyl-tRNA editing enzyme YbaK/EbsC (Cys-tRNA(Pro) deacylase)